ncbi:gram domain-containing protein, partial [Cystoisospora suis]
MSHIIAIRKKINALFFDNSIEIELADGQRHFFATFLNRDKVSSSPPHLFLGVYIQTDTAETERERDRDGEIQIANG